MYCVAAGAPPPPPPRGDGTWWAARERARPIGGPAAAGGLPAPDTEGLLPQPADAGAHCGHTADRDPMQARGGLPAATDQSERSRHGGGGRGAANRIAPVPAGHARHGWWWARRRYEPRQPPSWCGPSVRTPDLAKGGLYGHSPRWRPRARRWHWVPLWGRGPARAVARGPTLQWGVGGTTGAAAALPLLARAWLGRWPGHPPSPPLEGRRKPRYLVGNVPYLLRGPGGGGNTRRPPPSPPPSAPAAKLGPLSTCSSTVLHMARGPRGRGRAQPRPPLPPLTEHQRRHHGLALVRWWYRQAAQAFPHRP